MRGYAEGERIQFEMPDDDPKHQDRSFPPTAWTLLLTARDPATAKQAREEVCKAYWRPVCSYLQSLGLEVGHAEDLTQNILAHFCNDGWIENIDRAKGRLRHFFKATARNALANHFRNAKREKRGGDAATLSLDEISHSFMPQNEVADDASFDQHWAWTVFERAVGELAAQYERRGKGGLFAALKSSLISPDEMQGYAQIGSQFGVGEQQITIEVHRLRRRMAERLRAEVAGTLDPGATSAEIDVEMRYLVKALAHERRH